MKNYSMPPSKNRINQFSRTFCDDHRDGGVKMYKKAGGLNGSKASKVSGNTSHEDAITHMRMNSMKAS